MHGYLCSATMEIFMNQDKITRDLSPIPSYVRNPSSLYVTDMPSDATPCIPVQDPLPSLHGMQVYCDSEGPNRPGPVTLLLPAWGGTSKDKPCSTL